MWFLLLACASPTPPQAPAAAPSAPTRQDGAVPTPLPPGGSSAGTVAEPERPEPQPAAREPEPDHANDPPPGWVDLADHIPGVVLEIRYHTPTNFTGAPLPGYGVPGAWLQREPADALARVQAALGEQGKGLKVYDAYRPLRGTLGMVAWAKRTDQEHLLNGYIARRSGHNKGNTIDLSVIELATGAELDMGTPWDTLDERSHTRNATGAALENRLLLRTAMHAEGWRNYSKEWWHYSFAMEGDLRHRDVPYACFEPGEGAWTAPEGWAEPGFRMPMAWVPSDCSEPQ